MALHYHVYRARWNRPLWIISAVLLIAATAIVLVTFLRVPAQQPQGAQSPGRTIVFQGPPSTTSPDTGSAPNQSDQGGTEQSSSSP